MDNSFDMFDFTLSWISYDNDKTLQQKCIHAKDHGYRMYLS